MSATKNGHDMTMETFKAALASAKEYGHNHICLGGGEPTLHPDFEKMLFLAIGTVEDVFIITNGSQTDRALVLAKLAGKGVIGAELSQDQWHDEIDSEVVEAFTVHRDPHSYRGYRDATEDRRGIRTVRTVLRQGRGARKSFMKRHTTIVGCACDGDPHVDPMGNVHQCGCLDAPIVGDVFDGFEPLSDEHGDSWVCHRKVVKNLRCQE